MKRRISIALFTFLLASLLANALDRQPNADYRARRMKLAEKAKGGIILLFAKATDNDYLTGFQQDPDFLYLTGWNEPGAALLIAGAQPASDGNPARPYTEVFLLPNHNHFQERWTGPKLGPHDPDATAVTGFEKVMPLDNLHDALASLTGDRPSMILSTPTSGGAPRQMPPRFRWSGCDAITRCPAPSGPSIR